MSKTEILVAGRNETIRQTIQTLINSNDDWTAAGASNDEEAIEKFHQRSLDVLVLTNDIVEEEERKLCKIFTIQNPDVVILRHSGDDASLLTAEIAASLDKQRKDKKPSFSFVDDALKNAGFNIIVQ